MLELLVLIISFISLSLQSSFFDTYAFLGIKPDLLLVSLVFYAIFKGPLKGGIIGACLGLLEDLYIGQILGPCLLIRLLIGAGVGFFSRNIYKESVLIPLFILLFATLASNSFFWIYHSLSSSYISWTYYLKVVLLQSAYNALFTPFFYFIKAYARKSEKGTQEWT